MCPEHCDFITSLTNFRDMKLATFCACFLTVSLSGAYGKTYVYTQVFTNNVAPSACDCSKWNYFWESAIGDISLVQQILWTADVSSDKYTCSGNAAKLVAYAMVIKPHGFDQIVCDNGTWFTGPQTQGFPDIGNAIQIGSCTSCCAITTAVKPCWANSGYGGFVPIDTCSVNVPSQTVTITVVSSDVIPTPISPATVTFSDTYVNQVAVSATQCSAWQSFWQTQVPLGQQLVISLSGSAAAGYTATCSGISASMVALSQYAMSSTGCAMCDGGIPWCFNNPIDYRNAIGVNEGVNSCDSGKVVRPCWGDAYWGGFGGVNCVAPTQTFTVNVTIGNPIVVQNTSSCSVDLLDNSTWGIISTVGCTDTSLQCNAGFIAAGSISAIGRYNCSNEVWFPAKPTCTAAITPAKPAPTTITAATTTKTATRAKTNSKSAAESLIIAVIVTVGLLVVATVIGTIMFLSLKRKRETERTEKQISKSTETNSSVFKPQT